MQEQLRSICCGYVNIIFSFDQSIPWYNRKIIIPVSFLSQSCEILTAATTSSTGSGWSGTATEWHAEASDENHDHHFRYC